MVFVSLLHDRCPKKVEEFCDQSWNYTNVPVRDTLPSRNRHVMPSFTMLKCMLYSHCGLASGPSDMCHEASWSQRYSFRRRSTRLEEKS